MLRRAAEKMIEICQKHGVTVDIDLTDPERPKIEFKDPVPASVDDAIYNEIKALYGYLLLLE